MANEQNLEPYKIKKGQLTKEEASKRGKNGAIKSAEVKRQQKSIKQRINFALEYLTNKAIKEASSIEDKALLQEAGLDIKILTDIAKSFSTEPQYRLKAIQMMHDRIEGTPVQKQELTGADGSSLTPPIIQILPVTSFNEQNNKS